MSSFVESSESAIFVALEIPCNYKLAPFVYTGASSLPLGIRDDLPAACAPRASSSSLSADSSPSISFSSVRDCRTSHAAFQREIRTMAVSMASFFDPPSRSKSAIWFSKRRLADVRNGFTIERLSRFLFQGAHLLLRVPNLGDDGYPRPLNYRFGHGNKLGREVTETVQGFLSKEF